MSFDEWLATPSAGREFCYLSAPADYLAQTREMRRQGRSVAPYGQRALDAAMAAVHAYMAGMVELVQRRKLGATEVEYIALRRVEPIERTERERDKWGEWMKAQRPASKAAA